MNKFSVQAKIRLSFLLVFVVMMSVAIYLFLQMKTIGEQTRLLYEHPYQVSNTIREIKSEIFLNQNRVRDIRFVDNDRQLDSIKAEIDKRDKVIRQGFKIVSQKFLGSKALADSTLSAYDELKNTGDRFYQLKKENKADSIQILLKSDTRVKFDKTVFLLTNISDFAENKADTTFKKVIETDNNSTRISIILIIISGLLVIFFIWYVTRSITRPIKTFVSEANILLKKDEKARITADEHIMVQTLAELKNAYLNIEVQNHEIELKNNELAGINNELEVDMPTKLTTPCRSNLQHFCRYV
jgi:methyl-accepting chemotaxis protein